MIDAHTHLNSEQLYPDRKLHLGDFEEAWWTWLITIWVNHLRNERALEIKQSYDWSVKVWASIWIHPGETTFGNCNSEEAAQEEIDKLIRLTYEHLGHLCAIGECGIDSHFERDSKIQAIQEKLFIAQCELAKDTKLPLVIHSRDNFELTYDVLSRYKQLKVYFHCRWYSPDEVQRLYDAFPELWIGFCGNLTYPKATQLRESFTHAKELWIKIVLETDAPYLSPQSLRGTQNAPQNVVVLYDRVKETYGIDKEVFIQHTKELYWW